VSGLPGDYAIDAEKMRARVQMAVRRKTGCHLTADMAFALDAIMGDGDWWMAGKKEPRP